LITNFDDMIFLVGRPIFYRGDKKVTNQKLIDL